MSRLAVIGHITKDRITTPHGFKEMPGGTAFYFSHALQKLNESLNLVTKASNNDLHLLETIDRKIVNLSFLSSLKTTTFENIYPDQSDHRKQLVHEIAEPFSLKDIQDASFDLVHLGALTCHDFSPEFIIELSRNSRISLEIQGFLRSIKNGEVEYRNWDQRETVLPFVHVLKANEDEATILTGESNIHDAAQWIAARGVQEVVITMGSKGSMVLCQGKFYEIPAYPPHTLVDATGCGDTYMAGYLYQRNRSTDVTQSGIFAAAMATIKLENFGPFSGDEIVIQQLVKGTGR